jgi:hypothetical protein
MAGGAAMAHAPPLMLKANANVDTGIFLMPKNVLVSDDGLNTPMTRRIRYVSTRQTMIFRQRH